VEAAAAEVEGARLGDGRDGSGRSLKQRLEDARQAQVGHVHMKLPHIHAREQQEATHQLWCQSRKSAR
jgi:predicted nuclease with TOPRIM domain